VVSPNRPPSPTRPSPAAPAALAVVAAALATLAAGCTAPPVESDLHDRAAVEKVPGIRDTADDGELDAAELAELIRSLDHRDPAVRFFAARTLQEQTGERFDYVYYRDAPERRPAADRWRAWYKQRFAGEEVAPPDPDPDALPDPDAAPSLPSPPA
jgi:hypothetical protein